VAIPDFILALRSKIGTDPLWLSGVTAVVFREDQVLLVRRADTGAWTPVTGIIDPGEQPADAAVREVREEADLDAVPERLVLVHVTEPVIYANGDQARYLDLVFRMRWVSGTPHPADGENSDARWFAVDELPPMRPDMTARIEAALDDQPSARFHLGTTIRGLLRMTSPATTWYARPESRDYRCSDVPDAVLAFHQGLPGYCPTPLVDLPALAAELEVGRLLVKDESCRLGLPAFKALGASWAIHRALAAREGDGPALLVTATDGNHGRAVAREARRLGHRAAIVVPRGVHPVAVQAIADEGATVTAIDGDYDQAVASAAALADREPGALLIQDTAWPGYETIPGWIVEGYSTLAHEVDAQLAAADLGDVSLVVVPVGVGSLAHAVVAHYRSRRDGAPPALLSVEPDTAAGLLASLLAGRLVSVPTDRTIMAGLNCGTPSSLAWPQLRAGLDAAVCVPDAASAAAAADLAALGVLAGPCGAASLAGARAALTGAGADQRRDALGVGGDSVVVLLSTEGAQANPSA
jgi:diaminopropionate ammonia-lyase